MGRGTNDPARPGLDSRRRGPAAVGREPGPPPARPPPGQPANPAEGPGRQLVGDVPQPRHVSEGAEPHGEPPASGPGETIQPISPKVEWWAAWIDVLKAFGVWVISVVLLVFVQL